MAIKKTDTIAGVLAMIGALSGLQTAQAQSPDRDAKVEKGPVEEVVVVGERGRLRQAIALKRAADGVYDSLSQDDIGRLPDLNVSDSFRRIAGASAVLDEDEGRFVTVRGLSSDYNLVTIDGIAIATHDAFGGGGRGVNLEVIPNSAVSRLEIFKSFTPNIDGHAIGGYLNLVSRSAFDRPGLQVRADATLGRYTLRDLPTSTEHDPEGKLALTVSNTFGPGDRFGALISLSYDRKARDETKIIPDGYSYFNAAGVSTGTPLVGNGFAAPNQSRFFIYDDELERIGVFARLDARLTEAFSTSLSGFFFDQSNAENRYGHQILSLTGITGQTATSGTYARGTGEVTFNFFPIQRENSGLNWSTRFAPSTRHDLTTRVGFSRSLFTHDTPNLQFRTPSVTQLGVTYEAAGLIPSFRVNDPSYWTNPANYTLNTYDFRNLRTEEEILEAKADYAFNKGENGLGALAGVGFRELTRSIDNEQNFFTSTALSLAGFTQAQNYVPPGRATPYLFFDYAAFQNFQTQNPARFTRDATRSVEASKSGDFTYVEEIASIYGAATFTTDRLKVIAGLRYEDVSVTTDTFTRLTAPTPDVFNPVTRDSSYTATLPSLNASLDLTDNLRLRGALSQSIGRPNPTSIGQQESVSTDGLTVTKGNPDLRPRKADNFDLALEYTFDQGKSFFGVAVFQKDISNEIITTRTPGVFEGRNVTFVQPINSRDAQVRGVEYSLTKSAFDFLPAPFNGLGFTGNATFLDGQFEFTNAAGSPGVADQLINQPKEIFNAALFYNWQDRAELRLAYHFAGEHFSSVNTDSPWLSRGTPDTEQWDFTSRYDFAKNWTLRFEARNVTDEDQFITEGPDFNRLIEQVDYGRSFWLGVSFRN
ncbi:MAG: TonB-dependent receptor [Caulobacterales bacterium]